MDRMFTGAETWLGGFYELALEFGAEIDLQKPVDDLAHTHWAINMDIGGAGITP